MSAMYNFLLSTNSTYPIQANQKKKKKNTLQIPYDSSVGIAIKIHHNTEAFEFGVHTAISLGSVALWHLGLFSFLRLKYSSVICSPDKSELKTQLRNTVL